MRLALDELLFGEQCPVAFEMVSGVSVYRAARNLRSQLPACAGCTTAQRPSENSFGSTINSPPQPDVVFF